MESRNIIFFDGLCHLCNGFVDTLINFDKKNRKLHFAPLQGDTAKKLLNDSDRASLSTVVLYSQGITYRRSEAIIRSLIFLGGINKLWKLALLIPGPIRDLIYNFIARNRYAWFGEREYCRLPRPEEHQHLLP